MCMHLPKDTLVATEPLNRQPWQNRSLLYDKYCSIEPDPRNKEDKIRHKEASMKRLIDATEHPLGAQQRNRLPAMLAASNRPVKRIRAKLGARMMVNMAGTVIENAGLCLDRHFGMPYIPGSALKGLALRGAKIEEIDDATIRRVFGEQDRNSDARKGLVAFLPAYPVKSARLEMDVMTCHHGKYYRGESGYSDSPDTEAPIPVKFPTVAAETEFEFVVCGRPGAGQELTKKAADWLITGITELGVGAKTAVGYGWFAYDAEEDRLAEEERIRQVQKEKEDQERSEARERKLAAMSPIERQKAEWTELDDGTVAAMVKGLNELDECAQRAFLLLIREDKNDLWKSWKKAKKGKGMERAALLQALATKLGETLP